MLMLGLPGNPVSSIVCAILFLVPALRALVGDPSAADDMTEAAVLGIELPQNDTRQDYLRAELVCGSADGPGLGLPVATPHRAQDSSMLSTLARSDALVVRAPQAAPSRAGEPCRIIRLDRFC
jgi:molybdopterin molybdotransferase